MPSPVPNLEAFIAEHLAQDIMLKEYAITARGRHIVSDALLKRLRDDQAKSLKATNAQARIAVARATLVEIAALVAKERLPPAYFVTLASERFAMPVAEAAAFDVSTLKDWTAGWLGTFNHLTVVEAALYTALPGHPGPVVSYHTHSLVWGCADWAVQSLVDGFNDEEQPLVKGRTAGHVRRLASCTTAHSRSLYMLKAPLKEYRVYPLVETVIDHLGGEVLKRPADQHQQKKRDLRPGDLVKIYEVLGDRSIPSLIIGSGKGKHLRRRIVARALAYVTPSLGRDPVIMPKVTKALFG